jgi:hypothetical protein
MDDYDAIILLFLTLVAAAHQLICSFYILFDDLPTVQEKKRNLKRKREITPYKRNVSCRYSTATSALKLRIVFMEYLRTPIEPT